MRYWSRLCIIVVFILLAAYSGSIRTENRFRTARIEENWNLLPYFPKETVTDVNTKAVLDHSGKDKEKIWLYEYKEYKESDIINSIHSLWASSDHEWDQSILGEELPGFLYMLHLAEQGSGVNDLRIDENNCFYRITGNRVVILAALFDANEIALYKLNG